MRHFLLLGLCLAFSLQRHNYALAQEEQSAASVKGVERFQLGQTGVKVYRPEKWGMVSMTMRNPQDFDVNVLATTHFTNDPTLQFGRRLWIPPHARLTSWHPIRMPALSTPDQTFFELRTLLMNTESGRETLATNETGALLFDQSIRVSPDETVTAVIVPNGMTENFGATTANSVDLIKTARHERGLSRNLEFLRNTPSPPAEELLDAVDQLVIASDSILENGAGITAIRRWVAEGGSLWVMADQVSPEFLDALLGQDAALTVIDRVDLTHVKLVSAPQALVAAPFERDLDLPAPLVRVVADNVETSFLVDGWPAAFWKSYGNGRILVTTLGPDGWLRLRRPEDPAPSAGSQFQTGFVPGESINILAAEFFKRRPPSRFHPSVAEEQVRQMIGYSIPSRKLILGTLLAFTTLIGVSAIWLARRGRLEWLGLATPIAATIAAGTLLATGMSARSEISDSSASVQLVQTAPGTDDVIVQGVSGVFSQGEASSMNLSSTAGGWAIPDMTGIEGTTRRLIWNDIDHWSWEQLQQKPGLRTVLSQSSGRISQPLRAVAAFPAGTLSGHVNLPDDMQPTDAILATTTGRLGLRWNGQGQWTIADVRDLGPDQYLSAEVLSDEQQRRSRFLEDFLKFDPTRPNPPVPTLYVWTRPWDLGTPQQDTFGPPPSTSTGSALVAVPLEWEAPLAGSEFTIPHALLTFREITGPDGLRPSGFFDVRSHQWVERTRSTSGWIAFDIPKDLLPLQTRKVEVTLKVTGAMGRLELLCPGAGQVQSVKVWENPVGTMTWTVEEGQLIPIDEAGRFMFRLDAGVPDALPEENSGNPGPPTASRQDREGSPNDPATYWKFEEISARITVAAPQGHTSAASPRP